MVGHLVTRARQLQQADATVRNRYRSGAADLRSTGDVLAVLALETCAGVGVAPPNRPPRNQRRRGRSWRRGSGGHISPCAAGIARMKGYAATWAERHGPGLS